MVQTVSFRLDDDGIAALCALRRRLARAGIPVPPSHPAVVLAAVVDAELLAVHSAVHDVLAGRVKGPVAAYLPGAWLPHCVLATERPAEAFAALHPVTPVRSRVVDVVVTP